MATLQEKLADSLEREQYMKALEKASVEEEITDFAEFVLSLIATNH